ncbi:hypothetical protein ACP70R_046834 [Stipagrostis hirtigluma subsp. patula]
MDGLQSFGTTVARVLIVPGKVTILGVFKRHAVAYSDCKLVFGVAELKVRSQECNGRTKL